MSFNPLASRKAKIVCNFGLSECNRANNPFMSSVLTILVPLMSILVSGLVYSYHLILY